MPCAPSAAIPTGSLSRLPYKLGGLFGLWRQTIAA